MERRAAPPCAAQCRGELSVRPVTREHARTTENRENMARTAREQELLARSKWKFYYGFAVVSHAAQAMQSVRKSRTSLRHCNEFELLVPAG